jgi:hypothetical protein
MHSKVSARDVPLEVASTMLIEQLSLIDQHTLQLLSRNMEPILDIYFDLLRVHNHAGAPRTASIARAATHLYKRNVSSVTTTEDLAKLLTAQCGISDEVAREVAKVSWDAVTVALVSRTGTILDPVTGLTFPPASRAIDYRRRPENTSGKRMSFGEYMADHDVGWGEYTSRIAMATFWLIDLDRPAYTAGLYLAEKEADDRGLLPKSAERAAHIDSFFLRNGVLTTTHLSNPPVVAQWQAKLINYIRKLEGTVHRGNRSIAEIEALSGKANIAK